MPTTGDYTLEVLMGGKPVQELDGKNGETYIESSLFVPGVSHQMAFDETDPYGEKFTQSWPVTPYEIRASNHTSKEKSPLQL
jgi:hypothetical protein